MAPQQLSKELRKGTNPDLDCHRWIVELSMLGGTMAQIATLSQSGVLKELPDLLSPFVDSDRVD